MKLTMSIVEVDGWEELGKNLDKIVVAKVLKISKHPNADKLSLVEVDAGKKVHVVCGGQNLKEGMLVAFAPVGARVRWHGEEKWTELSAAKIRGIESRGMICSAEELGLPADLNPENGILDISSVSAKPGESFRRAMGLDDVVFDIDNKSITHRPDLWGHYGIARELAALFEKKLIEPGLAKPIKSNHKKLSVKIEDNKLCPRYCGIVIDGIKIEPSPMWMQKRLIAAGIRPISNIVDVTNYILMELGQPLHAFDYDFIPDGEIIVRRAKDKEKITTIDDEKRALNKEMLVIANKKGPVAVAGVMGGENSEINERTECIIIESANFNAYSIRKTSTELGLRTESSTRFEKSLDPNMAKQGLLRAVKLIMDICPSARVASDLVDEGKFKLDQGPISLNLDFLNRKIGIEVPKKQVISILTGLGFEVKDKKDKLSVKIPTWRATKDISIAEDLVEEVARIYGYDNVKPSLPKCEIMPPDINHLRKLENKIINILAGLGLDEVYNYSFLSGRDLAVLGIDKSSCVSIENPISEEMSLLRPMLLPNILKNVVTNQRNNTEINIFEIGSVHWRGKSEKFANPKEKTYLPNEVKNLVASFVKKGSKDQFTPAANNLHSLLFSFGISAELVENPGACSYCHPGRQASVKVNKRIIGEIFELHPAKQKALDIDDRVGCFEINLEELLAILQKKEVRFAPLPKYPAVRRDLALICPIGLGYKELENLIFGASGLIVDIAPFDIYQGKGIPEGTKSIALHITFRSREKTLEADEIEKEVNKILKSLGSKGVKIR